MNERWLPVPGFESRYEVSDQGRVRTLLRRRGLVLKARPNKRDGYLQVQLRRADRTKVTAYPHRLVMRAFRGPRPAGMGVRHLNGIQTDNRLENLAWGTAAENNRDQVTHGTHHYASRTHCKHGHEFTPENTTRIANHAGRVCRECKRRSAREWKRKRSTVRVAA